MVAEGIQSILESYDDIRWSRPCRTGSEIIDQVETLDPDVILLDLNMPGIGGLSATEIMLERRPETRILILSHARQPRIYLDRPQPRRDGLCAQGRAHRRDQDTPSTR